MANKNAADHKQKGTPAKSPKSSGKTAPAKPPKKKAKEQPLNREERRKAAWLKKTERKVARQAITEVGDKASAGLTFDQLENPGLALAARQSKSAGPSLWDQLLQEVLQEQDQQFEESAKPVRLPWDGLEPEIHTTLGIFGGEVFNNSSIEDIVEPFGDTATRNVVTAEIRSLLGKTGLMFNAFRKSGVLAAQLAAEEIFEKEPKDSPLQLRLAGVILADDPGEAIEEFLEEVYKQIQELQIIASALDPEGELEEPSRIVFLGFIDEATVDRLKKAVAEEAIRLDLSQRLAGLTASTGAPAEVDETFATLIAEVAQAAEAKRRERATFRQTLSQRLRGRKEREGRRFSSERPESEEEFLLFLADHRGEPGVEQVLLTRQIEEARATTNRSWEKLRYRLSIANDPERAVVQNTAAMKNLLGIFAQIRVLNEQLAELDRPQPVVVSVLETLHRDGSWLK